MAVNVMQADMHVAAVWLRQDASTLVQKLVSLICLLPFKKPHMAAHLSSRMCRQLPAATAALPGEALKAKTAIAGSDLLASELNGSWSIFPPSASPAASALCCCRLALAASLLRAMADRGYSCFACFEKVGPSLELARTSCVTSRLGLR